MVSISYEQRPATRRRTLGLLVRVDPVLALTTVALAVIGVVMVYSATRAKLELAGLNPHYYLTRQAEFVVLGVVVMAVLTVLDYRWLEHLSPALYVGIIFALLAMFAIGKTQLGATRWINVGPVQLQPSAFGTLVLIVVVATFCARRESGLQRGDLVRVLVLALIPIVLVVKQPDLGSGLLMGVVLVVMLVVAGTANRHLLVLALATIATAVAMVHFGVLKHYQIQRLTSFLHQSANSTGGYNLAQSKAAIGSGGLLGAGLFHGAQTNLSYVPAQQTDFIFSAVGEQLGFVGSASVVVLLGLLVWRVLRAAQLARDPFGRLLATGAFTLIAFSAFENAAMTMGIMPIAGIPLPFLSYGGSATIAFFAAVGMAMSVLVHRTR